MEDLHKVLTRWSKMMIEQDFVGAEKVLDQCLKESQSIEDQAVLLQQIMHVRIASGDLSRAQLAMNAREKLDASGSTALSNAYFQLYSRENPRSAHVSALLAIERAKRESDYFTLYSAHALHGLLAMGAADWGAAKESLSSLCSLLSDHGNEEICWGDAVPFLEAIPRDAEALKHSAVDFAARLAPKIEDDAFRRRAELVATQL